MTPFKTVPHEFQEALDQVEPAVGIAAVKAWATSEHNRIKDGDARRYAFTKILETEVARHRARAEEGRVNRFAAAAIGAADFLKREIEAPPSILGDGAFTGSQVGLFVGRAGYGKTWNLLYLGMALARGVPWWGLRTPEEGMNVGLIALEGHSSVYQNRIRAIVARDGASEHDNRFKVICRPDLKGAVRIRDDDVRKEVIDWIRGEGLKVVMLDPLKNAHVEEENSNTAMGLVTDAFNEVAWETGAGVMVSHHEGKPLHDGKERDDMASARGAGRLADDVRFMMRLVRTKSGLLRLVFPKVENARKVKDVWIAQREEDGTMVQVHDPEELRDSNEGKVREALVKARNEGRAMTAREIEEATNLKRPTVLKHLKAIQATLTGQNRDAKWTLEPEETDEPPTPITQGSIGGLSVIKGNGLGER